MFFRLSTPVLQSMAWTLFLSTLLSTVLVQAESPIDLSSLELLGAQRRVELLEELLGEGPAVVAFLGVECPLAKRYAARLNDLQADYADRGVKVVGVVSNHQDSLEEIARFARERDLDYPVFKDPGARLADRLGATRTPEVAVLDGAGRLRYLGRIDDQYGVGVAKNTPSKQELRAALESVLAGGEVEVPKARAAGCLIGRAPLPTPAAEPTFTYWRDVAPIINQCCIGCHRAGEIGPFALGAYRDAADWGPTIAEVTSAERMPPWHASPEYGHFANDRRMPREEIELLAVWAAEGCPEGDPRDAPQRPTFVKGWQLPRKPDSVVAMAETPFQVPAEGGPAGVPYQYFKVPSGYTEDRWVEATEVQPGDSTVVHHVIVYTAPPGADNHREMSFLTAFVPGLRFDPLPPGSAKRIAAGSDFVFELHYTPTGVETPDITKLGLLFADPEQVTHEVVTSEIGNDSFEIPPHAAAHEVQATSRPAEAPLQILSFSPHMHLRGKSFRYELVKADGVREVLLDVPGYDFNWQTRYVLARTLTLPRGARLHATAHFDNSAENPANPDPTATVRWGDQSWEEMMLGYFDVVLPRTGDRSSGAKPLETGPPLESPREATQSAG